MNITLEETEKEHGHLEVIKNLPKLNHQPKYLWNVDYMFNPMPETLKYPIRDWEKQRKEYKHKKPIAGFCLYNNKPHYFTAIVIPYARNYGDYYVYALIELTDEEFLNEKHKQKLYEKYVGNDNLYSCGFKHIFSRMYKSEKSSEKYYKEIVPNIERQNFNHKNVVGWFCDYDLWLKANDNRKSYNEEKVKQLILQHSFKRELDYYWGEHCDFKHSFKERAKKYYLNRENEYNAWIGKRKKEIENYKERKIQAQIKGKEFKEKYPSYEPFIYKDSYFKGYPEEDRHHKKQKIRIYNLAYGLILGIDYKKLEPNVSIQDEFWQKKDRAKEVHRLYEKYYYDKAHKSGEKLSEDDIFNLFCS